MRTERTLQRIEAAFADAVSNGDYRAAEGWVAIARHVHDTVRPAARAQAPTTPLGRLLRNLAIR